MNSVVMELTGREKEILDEVAAKVEEEMACLSALSREQRLARFRERQYPHPISFEREIGGTVYTVNAHFSDQATETTEGKVKHILSKNITL